MEILALLVTGLTVSGLATVERHPSASSVSPDPNYVRCIRTPDGFVVAPGYWSQPWRLVEGEDNGEIEV